MSLYLYLVIVVVVLTITYILATFFKVRRMREGTSEMIKTAGIIRSGARVFIRTEFVTIAVVVAAIAVLFGLFVEKTSISTFILGAAMSSVACILGMSSATYANVRTTNVARETRSVGKTVKAALMGGSISGLSVQAFGLLGLVVVFLAWGPINISAQAGGFLMSLGGNPFVLRLTTYSLGCSIVAMFNRVAGGNFTKAADISSDILAKIRHDLPEDDRRVPTTIADFIGDLVNDIAGNCSDLLESFAATVVSAVAITVMIFSSGAIDNPQLFNSMVIFPIALAGGGLFSCLIAIVISVRRKMSDNPSKELNSTTYISAGSTILISLLVSRVVFGDLSYGGFMLGWVSPWLSSVLGIISGVAIGIITERYTSDEYRHTRKLAEIADEGEAFVVSKGDAIGSRSCLLPILTIGVSILLTGKLSGNYGVAISALGMLSFVATTVSIDAFGPIADNAGGIAESCKLPPEVRVITDKLDSVGNTTAAIGKGFAIGSAAFATVSLIVAYVGSYSAGIVAPVLNIASFMVIAGGIIGGALVEYFSARLTDNTIESARLMADEGDRQLSEPGVLEGMVEPDYNSLVQMATTWALKKMLAPSLLALLVPVVGGFLFGAEFVGGLLVGATIVAIPRAIFMGNSGGAFDNAKKYIESGKLLGHGKGSAAHKAAVTGDTIGDIRKDVVGVALDIFIKMMSTVANTLVGVFVRFSVFR